MPFVKGQSKTGGKQQGTPNAKTKQWEQLGESIVSVHTERFNSILTECDDETFLDNYLSVLEYFKPKLNRTAIEGTGTPVEVKVVTFQ